LIFAEFSFECFGDLIVPFFGQLPGLSLDLARRGYCKLDSDGHRISHAINALKSLG
jgi:hypothetical protein